MTSLSYKKMTSENDADISQLLEIYNTPIISQFISIGDNYFHYVTNSKNVYLALGLAKRKGCYTAAFLGKDGGTIKDVADLPLVVKCQNTPHIQECHIFIGHMVCDLVDQAF